MKINVGRMDEKFSAEFRQPMQQSRLEPFVSKPLPAISDDKIVAIPAPTTEIQHQSVSSHRGSQFFQALPINSPFTKDPRGDDHV